MEVNDFIKNIVVSDHTVVKPIPNIFGINGKIGSGKDTVGKIIKYLTLRHKQLPNGYDPERDLVSFNDFDINTEYNLSDFEIKKFAGKLKTMASLLTGIPSEKFEDQEFKKLEMPECWNKLQQSGRGKAVKPMTYRQFLQELGTDAMRDGLHTNVWVNALFSDYKPLVYSDRGGFEYPSWIITDMRFPNEMEAVKEKGGITIRVVRPGTKNGNHPSETALDNSKFDYEIINNGTLEYLVEKVRIILKKEGVI